MSSVGLSGTLTESVFVYVYMRICVFVYLYLHIRQMGTLFLWSSYHYIFENIAYVRHICKCVIVFFVYLHVRQMVTLFLRSSYHYFFKIKAHVGPMCNIDRSCICVFLFVFLQVRHSGGPRTTTFSKIPKIREREGNKKIHSRNSGMGTRDYSFPEMTGNGKGSGKKTYND